MNSSNYSRRMRNKTAEKSSSSRLCLSTTVVTVIALWVSTAQAADSSRGRVEYHLPIDEHRRERQQQQQQQPECEAGDASCQQPQQQQQQQQGIKQTQNHTGRGTPTTTTAGSHTNNNNNNELKQASKESDDGIADTDYFVDDDDDEEDGPVLLKWLNEKMVPHVKACGVYLAPSTIPGAGLGMFAGRKYKRQEVVTQGDIVIPLSEIDWHNGFELSNFLWEEYTWSDSSFTRMTEENGYQSGLQGCSPGIGAAINCDLPLVNVIDTWSKIDGAGMHRSKDPGAGAITPYNDRKSRATRTIQAGEELYIDYGESYFSTRENTYGLMPLHRHYTEANDLMEKYIPLRDKVFEHVSSETLKDEMQKDLWDVVTNFGFETRGMNALPQNYSEIDEVMEMGGTEWRNYKRSIRDLQWLDEHGQCMDNIKPGKSNIPNAGRGVFATRSIPKGSLVSPAPLIHIKDKKELIMYDLLPENEKGLVHRNASRPVGHQLLLNYCFGHPNSTLLLSPYGLLSSLINHSPDKANTRIQWTTSEMRSPEWMEMPVEEWVHESHSGLQFDFIALRDIAANEEITIDYGKEWETAWKDHVTNWRKPKGADKYQAAYDMQKDIDADVPTEEEGGLGEHIQCYCHNHWRLVNGLPESDDDYHRCRPVKRFKGPQGDTRYMVELYYIGDDDWQSSYAVTEVLFDVQRSVFHFEDTSYSRDHQQPFTFRHEIILPDDMFPTAWMNKNN